MYAIISMPVLRLSDLHTCRCVYITSQYVHTSSSV